jgi:multidrug resistance efflux pump
MQAMPIKDEGGRPMTNPNPVAPKTYTPAKPESSLRKALNANRLQQTWDDMDEELAMANARIVDLESTLAAERASRKQAEAEQFNAGIEAAAKALEGTYLTLERDSLAASCRGVIRALSKPTPVSPEQEKP